MLTVTVGRQMTQRRSLKEVRENIDYLANLPRTTSLKIQEIDVAKPEQEGLLYNYRGVIRYVPKKVEKPERIKRDERVQLIRIRRACEHKWWGRAPWYILGDAPPTNGHSASASPTDHLDDFEDSGETPTVTRYQPTPQQSLAPELPDDGAIREAAEQFNILSDPTRLKILLILVQRERNVTELCEDLDSQSQPAVSHHLSLLRHARLIEQRREGKHNYYSLTDEGRGLADLIGTRFIQS